MASSEKKIGDFKTTKEFFEFVQGLSRNDWAEKHGYAGSVDITPKFSVDLAALNKAKKEIEKELSHVNANIEMSGVRERLKEVKQEMSDLESITGTLTYEQTRKWYKLSKELEGLNKKAEKFYEETGKTLDELEDINDLTEKANKLELKRIINNNQINKLQRELSKELDYQNKKHEGLLTAQEKMKHLLDSHILNTQKFNSGLEEVKAGFNGIKASIIELLEPWAKLDQAAANYARNIGMSASVMREFRKQIINTDRANKIAERTGLSPEEQIKIMSSVTGDIGRQIGFSDKQHDLLATGSFLFGEDTAKDYVTRLENFGISTEEAMNRATDLFKESSNTGIAFSKTSKIFLDNLRLAQNYTFRNGVKGLSDMAKRSAEIKMNISEVSRFVDKTSTLEGSLQSAAGLSVLGGSFALGANPLQMLYNGLQDFEGAEKQMENMLKGLVTFNDETKQLEMSAFNRQRLKAASQAMGVNYEEMQNMAFAMGREGIVNPILDQLGIDKESDVASTIKNRSYLNDKGEAMINVGGKKKAVGKLSTEDIEELKNANFDDSQNLNDIASSTRGILDMIKGVQEGRKANLAYLAENTFNLGEKAKSVVEIFTNHTNILTGIQLGVIAINGILMKMLMMGNGLGRMATSFGGTPPPTMGTAPAPVGGGLLTNASAAQKASLYKSEFAAGKSMGMSTSAINREIGRNWVKNGGLTASQARSAIRTNNLSRGLGKVGGAMGLGLIGAGVGIGGSMLENSGSEDLNSGNSAKYGSAVGKMGWGRALEYGGIGLSTGALIGSLFGPWGTAIGAGVGALAGGIYGGISGYTEAEDMRLRKLIAAKDRRFTLQGDYSNHDLEIIAERPSEIDENIRRQLREKDGITDAEIDNYIKWNHFGSNGAMGKAHGGIISGRGTGTSDSNLAWLSNREYVMPARATAKPNNRLILDSMRDGADLIPSFKDGGSLIKPNGNHMNIMKVSERGKTKSSGGSDQKLSIGEVKIAPINIGGTIKLDLGQYSKSVDAKELLNNTMFVKNLTDLIAKNLNKQVHFGYDKDTFYKKF